MHISLAPILLAIELAFLFLLAWRTSNRAREQVNIESCLYVLPLGNGSTEL